MALTPNVPKSRIEWGSRSPHASPKSVAQESPVAFEINGLGYAVMLATPCDLEDFATGFAASEGLIESADDIVSLDIATVERGTILRLALPESQVAHLRERLRLRLVEGSCGLCGLETIDEVLGSPSHITSRPLISAEAIEIALGAFRDFQPMGRETGAMHAAAFSDATGAIIAAREDIGRHNALDKLVGHMMRSGINPAEGFILLSARCSYELVEKTTRAGTPALVTISAASDLAIQRACETGLTLVSLARDDGALVMNDPHAIFSS